MNPNDFSYTGIIRSMKGVPENSVLIISHDPVTGNYLLYNMSGELLSVISQEDMDVIRRHAFDTAMRSIGYTPSNAPSLSQGITGREPELGGDRKQK